MSEIKIENFYSEEVEKSILGAFLIEKSTWIYINEIEEADFYNSLNIKIYGLIRELYQQEKTIDVITVKEKAVLKKFDTNKIFDYLIQLTDYVVTTSNIDYYIKILKNLSVKRQIISVAYKIPDKIMCMDREVEALEIKNEVLQDFISIKAEKQNKQNGEMLNVIAQAADKIEKKYNNRDDLSYKTGFFDLDKATDRIA